MKNKETLEEEKDLSYYKVNAEEDYLEAPISVLRYISELERREQDKKMYSKEEVLKFSEWFAYELKNYGSPTEENIIKALKEIKRIFKTNKI